MRILCIVLLSALTVGVVYGQETTENIWQSLAKITYTKQYDELLGFKVDVPVFSEEVKALEGQEIEIKGYVIPVEGYKSHTEFIFSAFPYNMCFFCGGAGPETVMEVYADEAIQYKTEAIKIKGILELNDSDINQLMYVLRNVRLVE
ncbi:hypothetical protein [Lewinella cohaerens]|uniref:hypothetical protein n=1 Tax=Lewinella cohaerens TaxID=70995 RepID=UPI00035C8C97|nr:hypothetical protein [Lewinella cohaerens]